MKICLVATLIFFQSFAFAWGGRGHDTICEAATHLVESQKLQKFLVTRAHVMGHLCNIPDIYWRSLPGEANKEGGPTHYIDADILPIAAKEIPLDLNQLISEYTGKKRANREEILKSVPHELGTLWWRVDQFFRRATMEKANFAKSALPEKKQEQDESRPFNRAVYNFYVNLGLMGHYVGDASQPFHATDDYDGYAKGHGGIHSHYEEAAVANFNETLQSRIIKEARKLLQSSKKEKFLLPGTVLEKMRALTAISFADIDAILKADKLLQPSEKKEERGMKLRTPAVREALEITMGKFEPLIIRHMARATALLAQLWQQAYVDAGQPDLSLYRNYQYPLQPEFVLPDYYEFKK